MVPVVACLICCKMAYSLAMSKVEPSAVVPVPPVAPAEPLVSAPPVLPPEMSMLSQQQSLLNEYIVSID